MRFYCGLTWAERRQLRGERWLPLDRFKWHRKFAWLPVRLDGTKECRWLEWVERRLESSNTPYETLEWKYRAIPESDWPTGGY